MEHSSQRASRLQPEPPTGDFAEVCLSIWENEGGAPESPWIEARGSSAEFAYEEKQTLELLGVSVVGLWSELPTSLQRMIFELATVGRGTQSPIEAKEKVARFLHTHRKTLLEQR